MFSMEPIGFLLLVALVSQCSAAGCEIDDFQKCVSQVNGFADDSMFKISSVSELKESCKASKASLTCVNDYVAKCMNAIEIEVFKATAGGKIELIEKLCKDGSGINKDYKDNIWCWQKLANDSIFCNENFEKAQQVLSVEDMPERQRMFHGCCAYDWLQKCRSKSAEAHCNTDAGDFMEDVSGILGGKIVSQMCGGSVDSCKGKLHGVEVEDLNARYARITGAGTFLTPSVLLVLLFTLLVAT